MSRRERLKKNKKASVFDFMFLMIMLLVVGIVTILAGKIFSDVKDNFLEQDMGTEAKEIIEEREQNFAPVWDSVLTIITVGISLTIVILSFMIRSHPALYMIMLFIMVIYIVLAGMFNNVYDKFTANENMEATADEFSMFGFIMGRLPLFATVLSLIIAIGMFAKGD